jgi:UrcA family protein
MFTIDISSLFRATLAAAVATTATAVLVMGSAAPANAREAMAGGNAATFVIDLNGIDLASPAGEARIVALVERAARRVCATNADRGAAANLARRACIDDTLARSLPRVAQLAEAARLARPALADVTLPNAAVRR